MDDADLGMALRSCVFGAVSARFLYFSPVVTPRSVIRIIFFYLRPRVVSLPPSNFIPHGAPQVGTAGQRCTTLRRLYVHEKVYDQFVPQLVKAYGSVPIGNPLLPGTLMGPLHNAAAVKVFVDTVAAAKAQGGKVET